MSVIIKNRMTQQLKVGKIESDCYGASSDEGWDGAAMLFFGVSVMVVGSDVR